MRRRRRITARAASGATRPPGQAGEPTQPDPRTYHRALARALRDLTEAGRSRESR